MFAVKKLLWMMKHGKIWKTGLWLMICFVVIALRIPALPGSRLH